MGGKGEGGGGGGGLPPAMYCMCVGQQGWDLSAGLYYCGLCVRATSYLTHKVLKGVRLHPSRETYRIAAKDFVLDMAALERCIEDLPMRGVKGTTGTQATFLQLFDGDHDKVQ